MGGPCSRWWHFPCCCHWGTELPEEGEEDREPGESAFSVLLVDDNEINREIGELLLSGEGFAGRIEPVIEDGVLRVRGLWREPGARPTKKLEQAVQRRLRRFARFNQCGFEETPLF